MFMEDRYRERLNDHCREVIHECLNIVEMYGDTYVAIHRDEDGECVILVTVLRTLPLMSIIVADKLDFEKRNDHSLLFALNDLNTSSVTGWHSVRLSDNSMIYMYRQSVLLSMDISYELLFPLLKESISEYKTGKSRITKSGTPTDPVA
jgi:hypothetical protein